MNRKGHVPQTPFQSKQGGVVRFNLGAMVRNYYIAKMAFEKFNQLNDSNLTDVIGCFSGITIGYENWMQALDINQDKFDAIMSRLDRNEMDIAVTSLMKHISEIKKTVLIVPGTAGPKKDAFPLIQKFFQIQVNPNEPDHV